MDRSVSTIIKKGGGILAITSRDIRRATSRLIEKELYHYEERKKEYEQLRGDILEGTVYPDVSGVQTGPGDVTQAKAMRLQSGALLEVGRRLAAIEWAIDRTKNSPDKYRYQLIKRKYFEQRLTNQGIMYELSIGHDTFYRWKKEFIELIADRLGWEV